MRLLTQCPLTLGPLKAYRDPPLAWKKNCLVQSTAWSPCSKSCGLGISVRVNNDNSKCEMRKDRRLCLLRPCDKRVMKSVKVGESAEFFASSSCSPTQALSTTKHRCF